MCVSPDERLREKRRRSMSADDVSKHGWQLRGHHWHAQRGREADGTRQVLAGEHVSLLGGGPQLCERGVRGQARLLVIALGGPDQDVGASQSVDGLVAGDDRAVVVHAELLDGVWNDEAHLSEELGAPTQSCDDVVAVEPALQDQRPLVLELWVGVAGLGELAVDTADQRLYLVGLKDRLPDRGGLNLPGLEERVVVELRDRRRDL